MPRLERAQRGIGWHGLLLAAGIAIVVVFGSGYSHWTSESDHEGLKSIKGSSQKTENKARQAIWQRPLL
jgi:hypothetical protein